MARPLPPLDLLLGFEAAARHLSFTRAAGELFVTQSAVSRQIQALEEFLGVPLFERRHKSLALTDAGTAYYRSVAPTLDQLRDATRRLRETRTGHVLTVTTTISFASTWLVPRLARFRKLFPRVDVRIKATHEVVDLEHEGIDLAIRDCPLHNVPPGAIHLVGEHLAAMCSPGYAKEARSERRPLVRPADLRRHVILQLHDAAGRWPWLAWATWLEAMGVEELVPAGTLTFDQYDQVMQAALHGQGVMLGRMSIAKQHIRDKRLVALFGHEQRIARAFHAVLAKGAGERDEVRQFVEWLREEIRRDAASAAR
ncbi:MAG TPA: transcriptional regulator GcvA [Usitatibacter sp.]|nr:transcriptional regulator GcvA [Usitatibacter sp.]